MTTLSLLWDITFYAISWSKVLMWNNLCLWLMFCPPSSGKDITTEKSGILVTMDTHLIAEYKDKHSYAQRILQYPSKA